MKKKYISKVLILFLFILVALLGLKSTTEVKSIYNSVIAPIYKPGGGGGYTDNQFHDAEEITIGEPTQFGTDMRGTTYFRFNPKSNGKYKIFSSGNTDVDGVVYEYTTKTIGANKDISATDKNFCITCDLKANTSYFVGVTLGEGATSGNYTLQIELIQYEDDYGDDISSASIIELDKDVEGKINYEGDKDYFKLVPTQTGIYSIYTMGITDTLGGIYDSNNKLMQESDNVDGENFKLTPKLEANKPYFIRVSHKSSAGKGPYKLRA